MVKVLGIVLLVLGIFFRFIDLDRKVYWGDEVYTSLRISGYTTLELVQKVADGHLIGIEDLQQYQQPNLEKDATDTIKGLVLEEPQLTPLYFLMARFWSQCFGSSVAAIRSLSVMISLLTFPAIYWLCIELFDSRIVGWIAISLIAVSPLHFLYAQEARMYSLWTVTILLSSASLLQAIRLKTITSWIIYAVICSLSVYSYLLSGVVIVGHGIYLVGAEGFRWTKTLTAYLLAVLAVIISFLPWLYVLKDRASEKVNLVFFEEGILTSLKHWIGIISRGFVDFNLTDKEPILYLILFIILIVPLFLLIGYSLYFLRFNTQKRAVFFILILILITPIALIPKGSLSASIPPRYLLPSFLGIQLAISHLLATKITSISLNLWQQKLWRIVMVVLVSMGIVSSVIISSAETWWNKQFSSCNPHVARIINQANHPLVISDGNGLIFDHALSNVISLSYLLDKKVKIQLVIEPKIPKIPDGFSDMFLFTPSETLRDGLEKNSNWKLEPVYSDRKSYRGSQVCLWKLSKLKSSTKSVHPSSK